MPSFAAGPSPAKLIHFDLDNSNASDRREPFKRPDRVLARMEPVLREALDPLASYGLRPLCLMSYATLLGIRDDPVAAASLASSRERLDS